MRSSIRGTLATRQRRITDILNMAEDGFLVLSDVTSDEFGTRGETIRAEFAQINLAAVLFAVADSKVETPPELRTPKVAEEAVISVPPFKVTGSIYLMPGHGLREALTELRANSSRSPGRRSGPTSWARLARPPSSWR